MTLKSPLLRVGLVLLAILGASVASILATVTFTSLLAVAMSGSTGSSWTDVVQKFVPVAHALSAGILFGGAVAVVLAFGRTSRLSFAAIATAFVAGALLGAVLPPLGAFAVHLADPILVLFSVLLKPH